ncbi:MAG TPA: hypothetical protein VHK25_11135 [Acidimicrobiales bacterium]|nr:hypothetical protein [Acidimicrobiales bacterium]
MTKTDEPVAEDRTAVRRCRWCARPFTAAPGPGRPRQYCRRSCRQRDYEARRQAADLGLGDARLVVARSELDALHDRLYELEAAVEDVDRDLAAADRAGADEYREALEWVLSAARPLAVRSQ